MDDRTRAVKLARYEELNRKLDQEEMSDEEIRESVELFYKLYPEYRSKVRPWPAGLSIWEANSGSDKWTEI